MMTTGTGNPNSWNNNNYSNAKDAEDCPRSLLNNICTNTSHPFWTTRRIANGTITTPGQINCCNQRRQHLPSEHKIEMMTSNGTQKRGVEIVLSDQDDEKRQSCDKRLKQGMSPSITVENQESSQFAVKRCLNDSETTPIKKCKKELPNEVSIEKQIQSVDSVSLTLEGSSTLEDHSIGTNTTVQNEAKLVSTEQQASAITNELWSICSDNSKLPGFDGLLATYKIIRQQLLKNGTKEPIKIGKLVNCFQETLPIICQGRHTATRNDSTVFGYRIVIAFSTMIGELKEYSSNFPEVEEMLDKSKKKFKEIECHKSDEEDMIFQYRIKTSKLKYVLSTWSKVLG